MLNLGEMLAKPVIQVRNATGSPLAAGDLVYVSGWNETDKKFTVTKADADVAAGRAAYILTAAIADGAVGQASRTLRLTGQATNGGSVGDPVYLSTTAGGWTLTAPTGDDDVQQIVGRIAVSHASTGVIEFDLLSLNIAKLAKNEIQPKALASLIFVSAEQTGTGSSQNVAHGLGAAPAKVLIAVTELPDAAAETGFDVAEGSHDATNVVVTVTNTVKFKVIAFP